jgi:ribose transport system permease protein
MNPEATTAAPDATESGKRSQGSLQRLSQLRSALAPTRISGVYLWIAMIIFFSFASSSFFNSVTARTIASQQAVTAIVAIGLTIALGAGVFDLSIGGSLGLANIVVAKLMTSAGLTPIVAVLLTLLVGALIGLVNGLLVTKARIDPFIATLGTGSILAAAIIIFSGNQDVLGIPLSFQDIAINQVAGVPLPFVYVLVLALIVWYVLAWTPIGRRLYATGGGRDVARLAGVPTTRYIIVAFVCSAVIASLAGVLLVAEIGTGSTSSGPSYLLPAFAAGFLGATQFRPGRFNVWGTVLAVYLLATGVQGLVQMGADVWVPSLFDGLALVIAVGLAGVQGRAKVKLRSGNGSASKSDSTSVPQGVAVGGSTQ